MQRLGLTRTTWFVVIAMVTLAVLYVAVLIVARDYYEPPSPDASSYSSAPGGTKIFHAYLSRLGYRVGRLEEFDRIPRSAQTVILVSPFVRFPDSSEIGAMRAWVRQGGRLVLIGSMNTDAHEAFGFGFSHVASKASVARPSQPGAFVRGVSRVALRSTARLSASTKSVAYLEDASGPVLEYRRWGRGSVVVLSDSFPITNEGIGRVDHYALAANLVGSAQSEVLFDEFHHGYSTAPGPLGILTPSSRYALIALALACILFLYGWGKRLGPAVAREPVPQRSVTEYAYSLGGLFEVAGARADAISMLAAGLQRRAGRQAAGREEFESSRKLAERLAARAGEGTISDQEISDYGRQAYEARMGVERVGRGRRRKKAV